MSKLTTPSKPRAKSRPSVTSDLLTRDWRVLCHDIGERRAGTDAERQAADYIASELRAAGAVDAHTQPFDCISLRKATCEVSEPAGRSWRQVESANLVGAPATPGGRVVEGKLAWLELPEEAARLKPGSLRGCILALFGPLPTSLPLHRQLLAAAPLAVVHVDERLPFTWTKNDGVYPYWAKHHGMLPTVTVPYLEAWRWKREDVARLRVRVAIDQVAAKSQNVVATLPGEDPKLPAIALGAHHDTQCNNVGADDNASGVVCLLALARMLGRRRHRRTIQFLSFGTEEQLSVGSAAYVRANGITPRRTGLLVNFDSVSSPLGHFELSVAGPEPLSRAATRALAERDLHVQLRDEITPFIDAFPFNRAGVPSLSFTRSNFSGGRWQHHSAHDSLENISAAVIERLLAAAGPMIAHLAAQPRWPFASTLPAAQTSRARQLARELMGW